MESRLHFALGLDKEQVNYSLGHMWPVKLFKVACKTNTIVLILQVSFTFVVFKTGKLATSEHKGLLFTGFNNKLN